MKRYQCRFSSLTLPPQPCLRIFSLTFGQFIHYTLKQLWRKSECFCCTSHCCWHSNRLHVNTHLRHNEVNISSLNLYIPSSKSHDGTVVPVLWRSILLWSSIVGYDFMKFWLFFFSLEKRGFFIVAFAVPQFFNFIRSLWNWQRGRQSSKLRWYNRRRAWWNTILPGCESIQDYHIRVDVGRAYIYTREKSLILQCAVSAWGHIVDFDKKPEGPLHQSQL